jgi:hypothetical protein
VKEGLSEVDRWHAKCGDVGSKQLAKIFPNLKFPVKMRCEFCMQGKMHHLGHKTNAKDDRLEYLPGENMHVDLSGPYGSSLGGSKYTMLCLDIGSKFLWSRGLGKKSDAPSALKEVLADAEAASGRKLRFLQTDNDISVEGVRVLST